MAPKKQQPKTGPQGAYHRKGFGGVWRWAMGHGIKRWIRARNWARRRAQQAKSPSGFKKAQAAYATKIKWFHHHEEPKPAPSGGNIVSFDGKQVAGWIARDALGPGRGSGIWKGSVISGYRSPEYSTSLCEAMCGAPTCPGTCGGANSNHSCPPTHGCVPHEGAVDVSDAPGLIAYCRAHGVPLHGAGEMLPSDVNHCSFSGR